MLDGKRYYAEFRDEDPANEKQTLLKSPSLIATLRSLEKELRRYILRPMETRTDHPPPEGSSYN